MHHVNRNLAQALHDERSNVLAQELVTQKDEEPTPTEDTAIGYTCAIMATIFFLNLALTWFDDELFGIPQRLWEFVRALMPLAVITTLYCRLAFGAVVMTPICGCGIAASAVGLALFKFGLGHGVIPFAEKVGEDMPEHSVAVLIAAMLGLVATFAEPDLASLQMVGSHAHNLPPLLSALLTEKQLFLLMFIAVGVSIAVSLGMMRVRARLPLWPFLLGILTLCFLLAYTASAAVNPVVPLAFDAGCTVTGYGTVPIILAWGAGVARASSSNDTGTSGFGIIALCVLMPCVTILLGSALLHPPQGSQSTFPQTEEHFDAIAELLYTVRSVLPLILFLLLVRARFGGLAAGSLSASLLVGGALCTVGLFLFKFGVVIGTLHLGSHIGAALLASPASPLLHTASLGFVVGFFGACVDVEPSGICERVEKASGGRVRKVPLMLAIAFGMGAGASIGSPHFAEQSLL